MLSCNSVQAYEHAAELINCFASIPVGVEALVQLDRLVQLLESPAFARLRLHLLNPLMHPALVRCGPNATSSNICSLHVTDETNAFVSLHCAHWVTISCRLAGGPHRAPPLPHPAWLLWGPKQRAAAIFAANE